MRSSATWASVIGVAGLLAACGTGGGRDDGGASGIDSIGGSGTNSQGTDNSQATGDTDSAGTMSGTADDDGKTKFDLGELPDGPVVEEEGCTKVDFLFVIDNSGSMNDEQANLVNSFPGFISGIQSSLDQVDEYQVGVVTTDAYGFNAPGCNMLGGLVTQTGGSFSSNMVCGPYAAGNNYMTELDDLDTSFACAAQVGTSGSGTERPMDALVSVVNKVNGNAGQCNEGFLRDDALLVTVIITDEWDGPNDPENPGSSGTPQEWYDTVVAAKLGIPENAVALALINWQESLTCPPPGQTTTGSTSATSSTSSATTASWAGSVRPTMGPSSPRRWASSKAPATTSSRPGRHSGGSVALGGTRRRYWRA